MKVKITRDNGEEKKFSCEAFVLVLQDGKRTGITVLGSADAVQWACILSGLDEAKADVVEKNPLAGFLSSISGACQKKEDKDDES